MYIQPFYYTVVDRPEIGCLMEVCFNLQILRFYLVGQTVLLCTGYNTLLSLRKGLITKRPENRVHSRNSAIHEIMHCYLGPIVVHFPTTCDCRGFYTWIHRSLGVKFCTHRKTCVYCFLRVNWFFFYPLNSFNCVRICLGTDYFSFWLFAYGAKAVTIKWTRSGQQLGLNNNALSCV